MKRFLIFLAFVLLVTPTDDAEAARKLTYPAEELSSTFSFNVPECGASIGGTFAPSTAQKRSGYASYLVGSSMNSNYECNSTAQWFTQIALYLPSLPVATTTIFSRISGSGNGSDRARIYIEPDGGIAIGTGVSDSCYYKDPTLKFTAATWGALEFTDPGSPLSYRFNGTTGGGTCSMTLTGGANRDSIVWNVAIPTGWYFDDFVFNDNNAGGTDDTWVGATKIIAISPGSTGSCANVDEFPSDGATSVFTMVNNGDALDCQMLDPVTTYGLTSADTIKSLVFYDRSAGVTALSRQHTARYKTASGDSPTTWATITSASASYGTSSSARIYTDPTTAAAFTVTGTNSLTNLFMGGIATDASPDINVSTWWAWVEYVAAAAIVPAVPLINLPTVRWW